MVKVLDQIREVLKRCEDAGRRPVLILIHPTTMIEMRREAPNYMPHFEPYVEATIFGTAFSVTKHVKDFFLVDDRSWAEQTFEKTTKPATNPFNEVCRCEHEKALHRESEPAKVKEHGACCVEGCACRKYTWKYDK